MAPYKPPSAHYAHLNVKEFDTGLLHSFMGHHGANFYELTRRLNVYYIWWNKSHKIIEVWGPYESLRDNKPIDVIRDSLMECKCVYETSMSQTFVGK
jgi:hypothetical protein